MQVSLFSSSTNERRFIYLLCVLAMIRIFLFNAAYPMFNPIDELQHFDTIIKHAKGEIYNSANINHFVDPWSAKVRLLYASPEYMGKVTDNISPAYRNMDNYTADTIAENSFRSLTNFEIHSPPIYYLIAAQWYKIGNRIISNDGFLLYWLRFLNVIFYGFFILLSYRFCKAIYPENKHIRIGVATILTVFPNDVFYTLNSDVISPIFCLLALYMLFQIIKHDHNIFYYAITGFAISSTILVKLTNMPTYVLSAFLILIIIYQAIKVNKLKTNLWHFIALISCSLIPVMLWMGCNLYYLGDMTGTADKLEYLTITKKSFPEWFNHPIFRLEGLFSTAKHFNILIDSFWHGEIFWGMRSTAPYLADIFYTITSILFITAAFVKLYAEMKTQFSSKYLYRLSFFILLILSIGYLIFLSIQFDFGQCYSPSRADPFFDKGRLIIGCLVPFLILYLEGLLFILDKLKFKTSFFVYIGTICIIILIFSSISSYDIFKSKFNWYHMFS
jgi:hypothetical protein